MRLEHALAIVLPLLLSLKNLSTGQDTIEKRGLGEKQGHGIETQDHRAAQARRLSIPQLQMILHSQKHVLDKERHNAWIKQQTAAQKVEDIGKLETWEQIQRSLATGSLSDLKARYEEVTGRHFPIIEAFEKTKKEHRVAYQRVRNFHEANQALLRAQNNPAWQFSKMPARPPSIPEHIPRSLSAPVRLGQQAIDKSIFHRARFLKAAEPKRVLQRCNAEFAPLFENAYAEKIRSLHRIQSISRYALLRRMWTYQDPRTPWKVRTVVTNGVNDWNNAQQRSVSLIGQGSHTML